MSITGRKIIRREIQYGFRTLHMTGCKQFCFPLQVHGYLHSFWLRALHITTSKKAHKIVAALTVLV